MLNDFLSFGAGLFLLFACFGVMVAYWPQRGWSKTGQGVLGFAIFLGFVAAGLNTFWWQILGAANAYFEFLPRVQFREIGLYLDMFLKGTAGIAGILHMEAIRKNLGKRERDLWWWFEMPWYPDKRRCLRGLSEILNRKVRK